MKTIVKKALMSGAALVMMSTPMLADEAELKAMLPSFIDDMFAATGLPHGAGVAVIKGDRIVYEGGSGFADVRGAKQASENTSFYIASSTKSFTGLAALTLAAKGKLDLGKSLAAWFPEIDFDPSLRADQITIRHLLSHTHGIINDPIAYSAAYTGNHTSAWDLERLRKFTKVNEDAPFGTYDYTNLGYNIFSMILVREFGMPWQDILAEEVFEPAGMTRTSAYMSAGDSPGWDIALPYGFATNDPTEPLYLTKRDNTMHAAGGTIASAHDLARFLQAQVSEGQIDGQQVFPSETIAEAHRSLVSFEEKRRAMTTTDYGMGWMTSDFGGETLIHHFGGFAGTSAHVSFMPDHDIGVVVLMNEGRASQGMSRIIAGYAYDMLRDKAGTDETRRAEMAEFATTLQGHHDRIRGHYAELATRQWDMTRPFKDYAGSYSNTAYGTITVEATGPQAMKVRFGNLSALATPYKETDAVRLELVPGRGTGLRFRISGQGVTELVFEEDVYTRD